MPDEGEAPAVEAAAPVSSASAEEEALEAAAAAAAEAETLKQPSNPHHEPEAADPESDCPEKRCDSTPCRYLEFLAGAYFSTSLGPGTPDFHYAPVTLRLGWRPFYRGDGTFWDRGSALFDLKVAPIFEGPGSILGGPTILLRQDFRALGDNLIPYIQGGAGLCFTDAHEDQTQRAIGSSTEFFLEAELGARYRFTDSMSVIFEGGYQHISNADTADRNAGVNVFGGSIGVMVAPGRKR
jgi:hypothetical protein